MPFRRSFDVFGELVEASLYPDYVPPHRPKVPAFDINDSLLLSLRKERSQREARRRAFSLASLKLAENPDMCYFYTFTYDPKITTSPHYLDDIKNLFRPYKGAKYICTFEQHKNNPNLHVHMISNIKFNIIVNKNGYPSVANWHRGFSSFAELSSFDDKFDTSKYIFKYITKSEKVKHKYIYSSRGLLTQDIIIDYIPPDDEIAFNAFWNTFCPGLEKIYYKLSCGRVIIKGVRGRSSP